MTVLTRRCYSLIERAEKFDEEGNAIFELLKPEFYQNKYGEDEEDRMLTFAG